MKNLYWEALTHADAIVGVLLTAAIVVVLI